MQLIRNKAVLSRSSEPLGVEVEVEFNENCEVPIVKGWVREYDGSLRGYSAEYVFAGPAEREEALKRIDALYYALDHSKIKDSTRTSTHVHINVQSCSEAEILNMVFIYWIFEKELMQIFCEKERVGNLFCLDLQHGEDLLERIKRFISGHGNVFERYASVNLASLYKYGSIEFRALQGFPSIEILYRWIDVLLSIRDFGLSFQNPKNMLEWIAKRDFSSLWSEIFKDICFTNKNDFNEYTKSILPVLYNLVAKFNWEKYAENYEEEGVFLESPLTNI